MYVCMYHTQENMYDIFMFPHVFLFPDFSNFIKYYKYIIYHVLTWMNERNMQ